MMQIKEPKNILVFAFKKALIQSKWARNLSQY